MVKDYRVIARTKNNTSFVVMDIINGGVEIRYNLELIHEIKNNKKINIVNFGVKGESKLGGTLESLECSMGRINKYELDRFNIVGVGKVRGTIICKLIKGGELIGYRILDNDFKIINMDIKDAIKFGKLHEFSNAKVIISEVKSYISAIKGKLPEYEVTYFNR